MIHFDDLFAPPVKFAGVSDNQQSQMLHHHQLYGTNFKFARSQTNACPLVGAVEMSTSVKSFTLVGAHHWDTKVSLAFFNVIVLSCVGISNSNSRFRIVNVAPSNVSWVVY